MNIKRRSICLVSLTILVTFFVSIIIVKTDNEGNDKICATDACRSASYRLRSKANFNINPCDDFYEFACSNYGLSSTDRAKSIIKERVQDIISDAINNENTGNLGLDRIAKLYRSCKGESNREDSFLFQLIKLLKLLGGIPLLTNKTNWIDNGSRWFDLHTRLKQFGLNQEQILDIKLDVDPQNMNDTIIQIRWKPIGDIKPEWTHKVLSLLRKLDPELDNDQAMQQLTKLRDFHKQLQGVQLYKSGNGYQKVHVRELLIAAPSVNWSELLSLFINENITLDEIVLVWDLEQLSRIIKLVDNTSTEVITNYILYDVIIQVYNHFKASKDCDSLIKERLGFDLSAEYVRRYIDESTQQVVSSIFINIRNQLRTQIEQIDWIERETKEKALKKLEGIRIFVAYSDELLNRTLIDSMYEDLELNEDNLLMNLLNINRIKLEYNTKYFHKPLDKRKWEYFSDTLSLNAQYVPKWNIIQIFAGYLTEAHFDPTLPKYMLYATTGTTIGHEMIHSFDPTCVWYDDCGERCNWWDTKSSENYKIRANCIRDLYDGKQVPGTNLTINGTKTLNENIADIAGYQLAYKAFFDKEDDEMTELEPLLPDTNLSRRQIFWLTLANKRCEFIKDNDIEATSKILTVRYRDDPHCPNRIRTNVPLMQIPEFAKDFACSLDSNMNSNNKCIIFYCSD